MVKFTHIACAALLCMSSAAAGVAPRAEVLHWWTSGGESAALKVIAARYRAAGGVWIDTAVAGAEQARNVAVNRIIGGTPPVAAQFNTSKQFLDLIEEDMLSNVDAAAHSQQWDTTLPEPVRRVIKVNGHYYALPLSVHMPAWIWYSKAAFRKAGIRAEPRTMAELFAALDKLKAAGIIALAHGGQGWQHNIVFMAVLANVGGKELYLNVFRERDPKALRSDALRKVLQEFKRLQRYVDHASPGRTWNDTTALLLQGRAGIQIMGDWVKGEITAAGQEPGRDIGCIANLNPAAPVVLQGDAFIFPKSDRNDVQQAQKLLAQVMLAPETQLQFSRVKGSIPLSYKLDPAHLDTCTRAAVEILRLEGHHVGNGEIYLTAGQTEALNAALTAFWDGKLAIDEAQNRIVAALKR